MISNQTVALKKETELEIVRQDEMETIHKGLNFLVTHVENFAFYFTNATGKIFLQKVSSLIKKN